jgi:hypothetical protein
MGSTYYTMFMLLTHTRGPKSTDGATCVKSRVNTLVLIHLRLYSSNRLPKAIIVKTNYFYGSQKHLRNGPFAENARRLGLARVHHALERSALDNLPGVACGVLKPSAEQQGVQEQRHDGVLGGPRCRKESRQPTHAAWSSASAACIIHHGISYMLNRWVFTKCYHIDRGKLLYYTTS